MTAAAATVVNVDGLEGIPARAKLRTIVRVTVSGDVELVSTWCWRLQGKGAPLQVSARPSSRLLIGWVPPDHADAWRSADLLARAYGYRPTGEWTTVGRMPTCLVEKIG